MKKELRYGSSGRKDWCGRWMRKPSWPCTLVLLTSWHMPALSITKYPISLGQINASRHNAVYWANEAYLGFGMGAVRYINGRRELNTRDLNGYIRKALAGQSTAFQSETLDPQERARETMVLQLRRTEGIDRAHFRLQTGFDVDDLAGSTLRRYADLELLVDDGRQVRLTRQGIYVADALIVGLL